MIEVGVVVVDALVGFSVFQLLHVITVNSLERHLLSHRSQFVLGVVHSTVALEWLSV